MSGRQPCPECGGAGLVTWAYTMPDGRTHSQDEPCFPCSGTGFARAIVFRDDSEVIDQRRAAEVALDEARDAVRVHAEGLVVMGFHEERNRMDTNQPLVITNARRLVIVDLDYLLNNTADVVASARSMASTLRGEEGEA